MTRSPSGAPVSPSALSGTAPGFPGGASGIPAPPCYLSLLTGTLPPFPMHAAFPRPEYYGGSAPPAPSAGIAPIPPPAPGGNRTRERTRMVIAVGTALAGGPPHRSQRALLTHWAPA